MQLIAGFLMDLAEKLLHTSSDTPAGMNFLMVSVSFHETAEFCIAFNLGKTFDILVAGLGHDKAHLPQQNSRPWHDTNIFNNCLNGAPLPWNMF